MNLYHQRVSAVEVLARGGGYTSAPLVAPSYGDAEFEAFINNDGELAFVLVTNPGTPGVYSAGAPSLVVSGGGGSGASLQALLGVANAVDRKVLLSFVGAGSLKHLNNLALKDQSDFYAGPSGDSLIELRGLSGKWREVSRSRNDALETWTPALTFGGGAAGMTYGAIRQGTFRRDGRRIDFTIAIQITNKGTATGVAKITLPVGAGAPILSGAAVAAYAANMNGLNGMVTAGIPAAGGNLTLRHGNANGAVDLTEANFSNVSFVYLAGSYLI